jgi:hypothetical protein
MFQRGQKGKWSGVEVVMTREAPGIGIERYPDRSSTVSLEPTRRRSIEQAQGLAGSLTFTHFDGLDKQVTE